MIRLDSIEEKSLYYALLASVLVHLNILAVLLFANAFVFKKPAKAFQVSYRPLPPPPIKRQEASTSGQAVVKERKISPSEVFPKDNAGVSPLIKEVTRPASKLKIDTQHAKSLSQTKRKVIIPSLKAEKITNPDYVQYYKDMEKRLKERAESYLNDPDFTSGEIVLTFIIASSGILKEVKIVEEESGKGDFLRRAGLSIIKEASPFPSFPKALNYPELPFRLPILFKE